MKNKLLICILVAGGVFTTACIAAQKEKVTVQESLESQAVSACVRECNARLFAGEEFSDGPCLSNEIVEDWVCDVAHSPRQDVDNDPENQCSAFRQGNANHFVELDLECRLIKKY